MHPWSCGTGGSWILIFPGEFRMFLTAHVPVLQQALFGAIKGETVASMHGPDAQWRNRGGPPTSDVVRDLQRKFDKNGDGRFGAAEHAALIAYIKENVYK